MKLSDLFRNKFLLNQIIITLVLTAIIHFSCKQHFDDKVILYADFAQLVIQVITSLLVCLIGVMVPVFELYFKKKLKHLLDKRWFSKAVSVFSFVIASSVFLIISGFILIGLKYSEKEIGYWWVSLFLALLGVNVWNCLSVILPIFRKGKNL